MKKLNLVLLTLAMTFSSIAFGVSPREACKDDMKKYCDGKRGKERRSCLKENESNLSQGCKTALEEMKGKVKARGKEIRQACKDDVQTFCKDVKRGKGKKLKCLRDNEASLSENCRNALSKGKQKKM